MSFDAKDLSTANSYHWNTSTVFDLETQMVPAYTAFNTATK